MTANTECPTEDGGVWGSYVEYLARLEAAARPVVSDDMVERAAKAMFEDPGDPGDGYTWVEMVSEDPARADIWRADARRVLVAALGEEAGR